MKIRRLSEIDLARFCTLPSGEALRHALRSYNSGGGSWSYDPIRNSTADALNARTTLLGPIKAVTWEQLRRQVERACNRGSDQRASNTELAAILFYFAGALGWSSVKLPMGRLAIGMGEAVRYWSDVVIDDGRYDPKILAHVREEIQAGLGQWGRASLADSRRSDGVQIADVIANSLFNITIDSPRAHRIQRIFEPMFASKAIRVAELTKIP